MLEPECVDVGERRRVDNAVSDEHVAQLHVELNSRLRGQGLYLHPSARLRPSAATPNTRENLQERFLRTVCSRLATVATGSLTKAL